MPERGKGFHSPKQMLYAYSMLERLMMKHPYATATTVMPSWADLFARK
jgi:hypothetical protein